MPTFKPKRTDHAIVKISGKRKRLLKNAAYASFGADLLGLGDLSRPATATDAIAAVYDLQGFTNLCRQIEPHLAVPIFLNKFLTWLMAELKKEATRDERPEGVHLWSPLPFLVKFTGDGLMVLWDASAMSAAGRRNVIVQARRTCNNYTKIFLKDVDGVVVDPPAKLRCGLARGTVYSVGDGNDYVGSCINMAARIQKLPGLTFAFNRRGFDLEDPNRSSLFRDFICVKKISVRGIGENELVGIIKAEYETLSASDKKFFRAVAG